MGVNGGCRFAVRRSTKTKDVEEESSKEDDKLKEGDEVRYGGKKKWFVATITAVHENGTFDVNYDDGDKERAVKPELVRRFVPFQIDQEVESALPVRKNGSKVRSSEVIPMV